MYTTEIRNLLGFNRHQLGRFLGLSAQEVYYIELGRIPDERVVLLLKRLEKLEPLLRYLTATIVGFWAGLRSLVGCFSPTWDYLMGRMDDNGQLVLGCCAKPRTYLLFTVPFDLLVLFLKSSLYTVIFGSWLCLLLCLFVYLL